MLIISLASQKGGAGKTTLVQNLARAAHEAGKSTIIIDVDPQMTSTRQYDKRVEDGIDAAPKTVPAKDAEIAQMVALGKKEKIDIMFLDLPPNAGEKSLYLTSISDFNLIPAQPLAYDLEAIETTIEYVQALGKPGAVVLNRDSVGKKSRGQDASEYIASTSGFPVAPIVIGDREQFKDAAILGQSVLTTEPKSAAAREIRQLYSWVQDRLDNILNREEAA